MKIYTKTGDDGNTSIIGGRISKASDTIELIGTLDEFNAFIGVMREVLNQDYFSSLKLFDTFLKNFQSNVFTIGALIAGANIDHNFKKDIVQLEKSIDEMEKKLQPITNFILPSGNNLSVQAKCAEQFVEKLKEDLSRTRTQ